MDQGRLDADGDAIEIVTMHKAKGLEWPVVIPINASTQFKSPDQFIYRMSDKTLHWMMGEVAPPELTRAPADDVAAAAARRVGATAAPDNLAAANALGLTTAVLSRPAYMASRKLGDRTIGGLRVKFRPSGAKLAPLLNTDAAVIVQALAWARDSGFDLDEAAAKIARTASDAATSALAANLRRLPVWALGPAREILRNRGALAV